MLKKIKGKFLIIIILLLLFDSIFTKILPASNNKFTYIIMIVILNVFLWKNGLITSKIGTVIANENEFEKKGNEKRLNILFNIWILVIFFAIIFINIAVTPKGWIFLNKNKYIFQIIGTIFLIYIIYLMRITRRKK